jgi:hypothetical protein
VAILWPCGRAPPPLGKLLHTAPMLVAKVYMPHGVGMACVPYVATRLPMPPFITMCPEAVRCSASMNTAYGVTGVFFVKRATCPSGFPGIESWFPRCYGWASQLLCSSTPAPLPFILSPTPGTFLLGNSLYNSLPPPLLGQNDQSLRPCSGPQS